MYMCYKHWLHVIVVALKYTDVDKQLILYQTNYIWQTVTIKIQ